MPRGSLLDLVVLGMRNRCALCPPFILTDFRGELRGVRAPATGLELRTTLATDPSLEIVILDGEGKSVPSARVFLRNLERGSVVEVPYENSGEPLVIRGLPAEVFDLTVIGRGAHVRRRVVPQRQRLEVRLDE